MNNIRQIITERLENAKNEYREYPVLSTNDITLGKIKAFQDCLNLIPAPRTEQEILKDLENYYAIVKNDEHQLVLINEFDQIIDIDKVCKRYECYYYSEGVKPLQLATFIDFQEHKLLNELFEVWQWI